MSMGKFGACVGCQCTDEKHGAPILKINKKRSCTDVPWLLVFISLWFVAGAMVLLAANRGGDAKKLIYKRDYKGTLCGTNEESTRNFGAWLSLEYSRLYICVEDCDSVNIPLYVSSSSTMFVKQCLPGAQEIMALAAGDVPLSESTFHAFGDLVPALPILGASAAMALIFAFVYTFLLRSSAGCMVWSGILLVIAALAITSYVLFTRASELSAKGENDDATKIGAYVSAILAAIFALSVIALRGRIRISIEVVKEASRALTDIWTMIVFPLFTLVVGLCFLTFWIWGALVIVSIQEESTEAVVPGDRTALRAAYIAQRGASAADAPAFATYRQFSFSEEMQRPLLLYLFQGLWTVQYLVYLTYGTIAGAVADWYFTPQSFSNGQKELPGSAVGSSFLRLVLYHSGTVACGALIIAIVQFIRAIAKFFERHSRAQNNRVQRAVFCCIQCCLKCVQSCLTQISKNALIWNAIYGDSFCRSAVCSFTLIWRNLVRVAAVTLVGGALIFIGKLVVAAVTAGICAVILLYAEPFKTEVGSVVVPLVVIFVTSYLVASLFMIVFETAIDSIFLCFIIDEEYNRNTDAMLASKSILKLINRYSEQSRQIAAAEQGEQTPLVTSNQAVELQRVEERSRAQSTRQ